MKTNSCHNELHQHANKDAAQKLNHEWIGIHITHRAVGLIKLPLKDTFGMLPVGTKAAKSSPPYEGGVAPASGDGVVLSPSRDLR